MRALLLFLFRVHAHVARRPSRLRLGHTQAKRMLGGSPAKQKLYLAMKRRIVRDEAEAMRARCAKSPTYHALLAEQAAKGNTESAELLKSLPAL